jgi:membrane protein
LGVNEQASISPIALLKQTANGWMDANALRLSAALSYYSIFSIAPLLVLALGIAGWFFGLDAIRGQLQDDLQGLVGRQSAAVIQSMVQSNSQPSKSLAATCVGIVTLLIGASGVFGQLKDALNTIWNVKVISGGWKLLLRERLMSFGMVLVIGFLLLVSCLLTTLLNAFSHWIEVILQLPSWIWGGVAMLLSLLVVTVLFALIFKVLPDVHIRWQHVWVGAFFTALLFEVGKFGLAFYLGRESTSSSFGAAGSVVLLLLWVYYASCILLFGAEFTKEYSLAHGAKVQPSALAQPLSAEECAKKRGHVAVPEPARESLAAVFPPPSPGPPASDSRNLDELPKYVREHMVVSMLGGVGCGLAVGLAERIYSRDGRRMAKPDVRTASHMFGAAVLVLLTRYGVRIWRGLATAMPSGRFSWLRNRVAPLWERWS